MIKPPRYLQLLYPNATWNFSRLEKVLYLTFDDGPIPDITPKVLALLDEYDAKATFFCIGENVIKHPEIFSDILKHGHQIGNHTYHHKNAWKVSYEEYILDIEKAAPIINSQLFRPPYGKLTPRSLWHLHKNYKLIMWDVISCDFDVLVDKYTVLSNVLNNATNGSIIVMHDSLKASENMLYALPRILEHFDKQGFIFRAIQKKQPRN
jgi:peptidoglycan/xylan/chitin deacetylase (PgdA/CDA1 family)